MRAPALAIPQSWQHLRTISDLSWLPDTVVVHTVSYSQGEADMRSSSCEMLDSCDHSKFCPETPLVGQASRQAGRSRELLIGIIGPVARDQRRFSSQHESFGSKSQNLLFLFSVFGRFESFGDFATQFTERIPVPAPASAVM